MSQNQPPHSSIDSEENVIGSFLFEPDSFHKVDPLVASDFSLPSLQLIFNAISDLNTAGIDAELLAVKEKLSESGHLERAGGASYLAELFGKILTTINVGHYVDIVIANSQRRQLSAVIKKAQAALLQGESPDRVITDLFAGAQAVGQSGNKKIWSTVYDLAERYENHVCTVDETRFITHWPAADAVIVGVSPGEVMVFIGYSGTFKSAGLHNMLLNHAMKTKKKSLFFSMEMPDTLVYQRTVQIALEQNTYFIESGYAGKKGENYKETVAQDLARSGADNLIVCTEPGLTVEKIEHYVRLARAQYGAIGVVGIDYLGLMSADGMTGEYERVSYCAEQLKNMAKRLNLPVVVLAQINRSSATTGELESWSAKGSGAVEASADYMLGILRNKDKDLIIKILKNRNGEANLQFVVDLDATHLKFKSLEPYNNITRKNTERGMARLRQSKVVPMPDTCPF